MSKDYEYGKLFTLDEIRWARDQYLQSFDNTGFEDYIRREKIKRMRSIPPTLFDYDDMLFSDYDLHPSKLNFELVFMDNTDQLTEFFDMLEVTTSHLVERSQPGRSAKIMVKETTTGKIFGFIRIGSPTINMAPRNTILGVSNYTTTVGLSEFNNHCYMGQIIVPVQPAGFNYAAGKLLSLICVSHEVRKYFDNKYNMESTLFETTSLYGSIKATSQYDGLKPYIRKGGQSDSNFMPAMQKEYYMPLRDWFEERLGEPLLDPNIPSSRKMKIQRRMESIIMNVLKENGRDDEVVQWRESLKTIQESMTTQKNYYYSTFGYDNSLDYMTGRDTELRKGQNWDKFHMDHLVEWWRKKATNRYEKLVADNRLRTDLEVWSDKKMQETVDIVR